MNKEILSKFVEALLNKKSTEVKNHQRVETLRTLQTKLHNIIIACDDIYRHYWYDMEDEDIEWATFDVMLDDLVDLINTDEEK